MDPDKPNKPKDSPFKQQKLKSWNLKMKKEALGWVYIGAGLFFIVIGSLIIVQSNGVIEHKLRYDNIDECKVVLNAPVTCTILLDLDSEMKSPIFIYYEISNMYQNHRRYNQNLDILQLMGNTRSVGEIDSNCSPIKTVHDLDFPVNNPQLAPNSVANPCGLVAKSVFNDSYFISSANLGAVRVQFNDISLSVDRDEKFKNNDHVGLQWTDVENEHFIVWMSIAGLPTFKKLWGKIETDLPKGLYTVTIQNNYDVSKFSGTKSFVITTTSNLGGKMSFLGIIYLVVGCISLIGGLVILSLTNYMKNRRIIGNI